MKDHIKEESEKVGVFIETFPSLTKESKKFLLSNIEDDVVIASTLNAVKDDIRNDMLNNLEEQRKSKILSLLKDTSKLLFSTRAKESFLEKMIQLKKRNQITIESDTIL